MKKSISIILFISIFLYAHSQEYLNIKLTLSFNEYSVCYKDNFEIYIFYKDTNLFYRLDTLSVHESFLIFNTSLFKNDLLYIILKYKKYILPFNLTSSWNYPNLKYSPHIRFKIFKKRNFKKYIQKSYSNKSIIMSKLEGWEFDISCNGRYSDDGKIIMSVKDKFYRRHINSYCEDVYLSKMKDNGEIVLEYSHGSGVCTSLTLGFKSYSDFFTQTQLLLYELFLLNGTGSG